MKAQRTWLRRLLLLGVFAWAPACSSDNPTRPDPGGDPGGDPGAPLPQKPGPWIRIGGPPGGLGYDIRMRPDDADIMFVTDAWAGVYRSTDGGLTWSPANAGITVRSGPTGDVIPVFSLSIDPHDPDIVWAGTQYVRGIFKSSDGGESWVQKDNGVTESDGISFRGFTVDPRSSDIVYAAAEVSSWAWAGEPRMGQEFDLVRGVLYKTTDGGNNWTAVWRGDNLARYIWINPDAPDVLYISTGIFDREASDSDPGGGLGGGGGIYKSVDGGATWSSATNGLGNPYVGSLFMHPQDPEILLAGTGNSRYWQGGGVYITTDGGQSWQQTLDNDVIESVEFSLTNPDIAYAGSDRAIYRSEDGGFTWQLATVDNLDGWGSPGIRAGVPIDFQVDPRDPDRIFANNYGGGNFLSEDGGRSWTNASDGYTGAQVRDIAVDPSDPSRVFAAGRCGLFRGTGGGESWTGLNNGPAFGLEWKVVAVDPTNTQHLLASNDWSSALLSSFSGGQSWEVLTEPAGPDRGYGAIVFAPSNPAIVYAGQTHFRSALIFGTAMPSGGVYRSVDGGNGWEPANGGAGHDANVRSLAIHPANPLVVYAATENHGVMKTNDGGKTWMTLTVDPGQTSIALSVAIDSTDPEVVFAGLAHRGLRRSPDGGSSWAYLAAGLPPEPSVSDILFNPADSREIFIADRWSGVYRSTDGGDTWEILNEGLRMREVNALSLSQDGKRLYAATEGEGVYRAERQ